jgi:hypothetical protein
MSLILKLAVGAALAGLAIGWVSRIQGLALLLPFMVAGGAFAFLRGNNGTETIVTAVTVAVVTAQVGYAVGSFFRGRH